VFGENLKQGVMSESMGTTGLHSYCPSPRRLYPSFRSPSLRHHPPSGLRAITIMAEEEMKYVNYVFISLTSFKVTDSTIIYVSRSYAPLHWPGNFEIKP
jgi:hypothetical protein